MNGYYVPIKVQIVQDKDLIKQEFDSINPDGRYSLNELFPGVTSGKFVKIDSFFINEDDEQILTVSFFRDGGQGTPYKEVLCKQEAKLCMDHSKRKFYIDTRFGVYYLSKGDLDIVHKLKSRK
ncbi:hypothetical protein EPNKCIFM_00157 [Klebsiella phage KP13-16]|nr:hypothetical protein EPNKCIFM_00157 [Klebsiella phage KP13-16]